MPYGSGCEPSRLCPQRMMARVLERTGDLPSLAEVGGLARKRELYRRTVMVRFAFRPRKGGSAASTG
jgi:hypothetical protein